MTSISLESKANSSPETQCGTIENDNDINSQDMNINRFENMNSELSLQINTMLQSQKTDETLSELVHDDVQTNTDQDEVSSMIQPAATLILPDLILDSLLSCQGKLLILFFTRRCSSSDLCFQFDVKLLNDLFYSKKLPCFSNGQIKQFGEFMHLFYMSFLLSFLFI